MDDDLIRLRAQIDQIDQQILDLLSDRLKMAEQVAAAKQTKSSVFRPERETQLLSRLCEGADQRLQPVIQAVWRAIISAAIARQKADFTIGSTRAGEQNATAFAAGQLAVRTAASAAELCAQIETGALDIGIIMTSELAEIHQSVGLDRPVKIIAALPLFRQTGGLPSAFVVATDRPEASESDRYVVYDAGRNETGVLSQDELNAASGLSVLGICTSIG